MCGKALGPEPVAPPPLPSRYLYVTIVYNITYSVALFALLMFYLGTHDMLAPFNPLLKFILVKSVVFFTFWQVRPSCRCALSSADQTSGSDDQLSDHIWSSRQLPGAWQELLRLLPLVLFILSRCRSLVLLRGAHSDVQCSAECPCTCPLTGSSINVPIAWSALRSRSKARGGPQGILIAIMVGTGAMDSAEDGSNLQNLLICLEMLPASIAMFYAFPYTEYTEGGEHRPAPWAAAMTRGARLFTRRQVLWRCQA